MVRKLHDDPCREHGSAIKDLPVTVGENLGSLLFCGLSSVTGIFLTIDIWVLNCEFDNYVCTHVGTPGLSVVIRVPGSSLERHRRQALRRYSAPVDRKSDAVHEAGIITGEEDDGRSKFLGLSYATCWR